MEKTLVSLLLFITKNWLVASITPTINKNSENTIMCRSQEVKEESILFAAAFMLEFCVLPLRWK